MAIFVPVSAHWLFDQDGWPQPVSSRLAPDAILTQTNLTGSISTVQDDPDSADGTWMTGGGAVVLRVSFPTPYSNLLPGYTQTFKIRARPGT